MPIYLITQFISAERLTRSQRKRSRKKVGKKRERTVKQHAYSFYQQSWTWCLCVPLFLVRSSLAFVRALLQRQMCNLIFPPTTAPVSSAWYHSFHVRFFVIFWGVERKLKRTFSYLNCVHEKVWKRKSKCPIQSIKRGYDRGNVFRLNIWTLSSGKLCLMCRISLHLSHLRAARVDWANEWVNDQMFAMIACV